MTREVERFEDMSPDGRLRIMIQDDGDVCVMVREGGLESVRVASVEFCNSGTRSPWTREALRAVAVAMEKDARGEPWPGPGGRLFFEGDLRRAIREDLPDCPECGSDAVYGISKERGGGETVFGCTFCSKVWKADLEPLCGECDREPARCQCGGEG